ncbi:hypothetical protein MAR_005459 [Mya arenaria]|uniref:Uncharacterized protein n=1 Tax=Mya arenaria TaxID=6604 RepID=A0ABY7F2E9_MYAAR|nr:hypothetical protein MAR_005459 [Mya arenaria]
MLLRTNEVFVLKSHNTSNVHMNALTANDSFMAVCKGDRKSINIKSRSTAYAARTAENRIILSIIDVITQLSSKCLALRGNSDKIKRSEGTGYRSMNHLLLNTSKIALKCNVLNHLLFRMKLLIV